MPQVGDTIQVQISGGDKGINLGNGGASIGIGAGASMSVPGRIVEDLGSHWKVELSMSIGGANTVNVAK